jgi:hypothetical protein
VAAAAADAATVTSLSATSESSSRRHACFCATHALLTSPTWGCAGTGLNSDGSTSSSTWCGPRSGPVPGRPNQGRAHRRSGGGRPGRAPACRGGPCLACWADYYNPLFLHQGSFIRGAEEGAGSTSNNDE